MSHGLVIPATHSAARASALAAILLAVTTGIFGCGGTNTGAFQDAGEQPNCQVHQRASPSRDYTGGENADTQAILTMMRYFTAHGEQPYCDGRSPSPLDKAWSDLYVRLSGR
jgi:hypothetical protein